jgi:hypothetical protein
MHISTKPRTERGMFWSCSEVSIPEMGVFSNSVVVQRRGKKGSQSLVRQS